MYEIEVVQVYKIKGSSKCRRTWPGIISALAWSMIYDRHCMGWIDNDRLICDSGWNEEANRPKRYECDCDEKKFTDSWDGLEYQIKSYINCPVHDRNWGYLRRLHTRLVRYILLRYPMPRLAGA